MRRGLLVGTVVMMAVAQAAVAGAIAAGVVSLAGELNRATTLTAFAPRPQATVVLDRHGAPAFTFFVEQREDVPLDRVSASMREAVVAVEDRRFFAHHGVDPVRIVGAAIRNVRAGRIAEGGSTITQQLARALQLSPVRTYERKVREAMIALQLEQRYSKTDILREYLNTVYFGNGYYGVQAAARGYFGKDAAALQPAEGALLAALVRSPSLDAPDVSRERATRRRNLVLRLMRAQGRITAAEYAAAVATAVPAGGHGGVRTGSADAAGVAGLYFEEEVRRQLVAMFGADRVLRDGLRVYTTYDPRMQAAAERAITGRTAQIARSHAPARDLQGSLVALDPQSGDVLALVGGRDFRASSFNRATQARRQAGSAFKPLIYAAALERGFAPGTMLRDLDVPIAAAGGPWLPGGGHEAREYTLRRALQVSSNRAAAQLLQQVGMSAAIYYAHRLGIESELPPVPSLALGTGEVTLLELTASYGAFANHGQVAAPRLITRIEDRDGTVLWDAPVQTVQAIRPSTAYLMSSMLSDVIARGTGAAARRAGFTLPAAGKTGTTDDYADAWFIGYTPHLVTGVWFGLDRPAPIMRGGFAGVVAVPAWAEFMRAATAGAGRDWFDRPPDIEKVAICRVSGERATEACRHPDPLMQMAASAPALLPGAPGGVDVDPVASAPEAGPAVYEDLFAAGTAPVEDCPIHGAAAHIATDTVVSLSGGSPSASAVRAVSDEVVVDRHRRPDGTSRIVMRQR